jgi:hypothetical protein
MDRVAIREDEARGEVTGRTTITKSVGAVGFGAVWPLRYWSLAEVMVRQAGKMKLRKYKPGEGMHVMRIQQ